MTRTMHQHASAVTRNGASRFADDATLDEEREALRVSIHSTSQRDRSAAQAVAELFHVDPSVVYRWIDGEIKSHPLRHFCELVDTCIAAKGAGNDRALEIVRLLYRRYLAPAVAPGLPAQRHGGEMLREAGELITAWSAMIDGCATPEEAREVIRECDECAAAIASARGLAVAVLNSAALRVEVGR